MTPHSETAADLPEYSDVLLRRWAVEQAAHITDPGDTGVLIQNAQAIYDWVAEKRK